MLELVATSRFRRDLKTALRRGWDTQELDRAITMLQKRQPLPAKYEDHGLTGDRRGQRDLHVRPDWVLIYRIDRARQLLRLERTGSHSDLGLD
ncbi:MAG: type II toxin-antitoxin system YafQ family toxin [Bifidobacteriaceae bacterium]|nr:type II toxin-antitoxin system YafQ family toxin [Bifidobacteriaceae bacterium]